MNVFCWYVIFFLLNMSIGKYRRKYMLKYPLGIYRDSYSEKIMNEKIKLKNKVKKYDNMSFL